MDFIEADHGFEEIVRLQLSLQELLLRNRRCERKSGTSLIGPPTCRIGGEDPFRFVCFLQGVFVPTTHIRLTAFVCTMSDMRCSIEKNQQGGAGTTL